MLGGGFHFHYSPRKAINGPLGIPPDTHHAPIAQMLARQGAKSRFVHSPGRLLLSAALFSLVLLTLDLPLGSFLLIEQDRFDGRNPRQGVQAL